MTAGKLLHTIADADGPIHSISFNPSEFIIASCSMDGYLRVYDLQNFELISSYKESYSEQIIFTPNGQNLLAAAQDSLQILTWEPISLVDEMPAKWANVKDIKVLPETDKAIACTVNGPFIDVWGFKISDIPTNSDDYEEKVTAIADPTEQQIRIITKETKDLGLDEVQQPVVQSKALSKKFKYIPSPDGSKVLNLDLQTFIKQIPGKPSQPMLISSGNSLKTIDDALDSLNFRHTSVLNIMTSRLQNIRSIRSVWNEEDIRVSIAQLVEIRETGVVADILRMLVCKPKLLTLEICSMLIPLLSEMLFEMYEEFIKSQKCKQEFENAYMILSELSAGGELGNVIRDTLNELQHIYEA
ncbi:Katanin p80 WD40 repeat-containing subunit B1 [Terramyces sp. JEL0728]|nr:Katanin p80 WD40 repeat-containing subunit B1 [Terramyces sp. JEL0728]